MKKKKKAFRQKKYIYFSNLFSTINQTLYNKVYNFFYKIITNA